MLGNRVGSGDVLRRRGDGRESWKDPRANRDPFYAFDNPTYVGSVDLPSHSSTGSTRGETPSKTNIVTPAFRRRLSELHLETATSGIEQVLAPRNTAFASNHPEPKINANSKSRAEDEDGGGEIDPAADYDVCGPGTGRTNCCRRRTAAPIVTPEPPPEIEGWSVHLVLPISEKLLAKMRAQSRKSGNAKVTLKVNLEVPEQV